MQLSKEQNSILDNYVESFMTERNMSKKYSKNEVSIAVKQAMNNKLDQGMSFNEALTNLDVIKLNEKINNIQNNKKIMETNSQGNIKQQSVTSDPLKFTLTTMLMIPIWIIGGFVSLIAALVALVGIAMLFSPVYGAFAFAIYDLGPAFGLFFFILGGSLIVMFICYWLFALLWEVVKFFINESALLYNKNSTIPDSTNKINFLKAGARANWKALTTVMLVFVIMFGASAAGTMAPKNGAVGSALRNEYSHEQTLDINLGNELNKIAPGQSLDNIHVVTFENLWSHKDINGKDLFKEMDTKLPNPNGEAIQFKETVRVKFKYSTKFSQNKITYSVKYNLNQLIIRFDYNDIEPMMNIQGYGYEIYTTKDLVSSERTFEAFVIKK